MSESLRTNIRLLKYFNFFQNISFYAPLALLYFQHVTYSFALAASILSIALVAAALFEIPAGMYSDLIGRKKTILLGALSMAFAVVCYALADGYWFLAVGAVLEGISKALYSGNNDAFLHNVLSQADAHGEFHHYRGKLESIHMLGASGAALLGGFLASWSFALLMWLSVLPQLACLATAFRLIDASGSRRASINVVAHLREALATIKSNYTIRMLSLANVLDLSLGPTAYHLQAAVYQSFWPLWAVGFGRALADWVAIPATYYSGKIIDAFGAYKTMLASSFWAWFGNVAAVAYPSFLSPFLLSATAVLWGPGDMATNALLQKEFNERQRATIISVNSFVASVLFGIFMFAAGKFADAYGPIKVLLAVQLFIFPTVLLRWRMLVKAHNFGGSKSHV